MKTEDLNTRHFVLDLKAAADLRGRVRDDPRAGVKLAAQQFEGMMVQMMLKSMREATAQDGLLDNDQTRLFTSVFDQQLAQNLSARGAFGFAAMVEKQLGGNLPADASSDLAASLSALERHLMPGAGAGGTNGANGAIGPGATRRPAAGASGAASGAGDSGAVGFANRLWSHAVGAARALGVPPAFLVGHAALESGWGKSEIRLPDGTPSYNLFGVKAGRSWPGASVEVRTTEYVNGVTQACVEKFRVYASYAEAFADYAALLKNNPRFAAVIGQQDGAGFARALQQSGYATDPAYADKLARVIGGNTLRQSLAG